MCSQRNCCDESKGQNQDPLKCFTVSILMEIMELSLFTIWLENVPNTRDTKRLRLRIQWWQSGFFLEKKKVGRLQFAVSKRLKWANFALMDPWRQRNLSNAQRSGVTPLTLEVQTRWWRIHASFDDCLTGDVARLHAWAIWSHIFMAWTKSCDGWRWI